MDVEDTNTTGVVSAAIDPSTNLDNPDNWNFASPDDEETGQADEQQASGTESEQAEETEAQAEETEAESEQEEDKATDDEDSQEETESEEAEKTPATIRLPNGEEHPLEEVAAGYMRTGDYTRKTQEVADNRRTVVAQAEQLQAQTEALTNFIVQNLPPEPDASLAYSDPGTYTAQKAVYEQQIQQVQNLLQLAEKPKAVAAEINQTEFASKQAEENAKLGMKFSQAATEAGLKEFRQNAEKTAKEMGFTDTEISTTLDHRIFATMHYAALGMEAEKAKETVKRKVADAPKAKAAPVKQNKASAANDAMRRLKQTGSIHDAVNIDFD